MTKAAEWRGYYRYYLREARRQKVDALQVLDEQWEDGRRSAERVLPYVARDADVLEIACGIGRVSRFVTPHCGRLYCADILNEALAQARKNLKPLSNVSFHKTSGYDLAEFAAESFDCVYSFTTFIHFDFELVLRYLAEIKRVLKPSGVALIEFKRWCDRSEVEQLLEKIEDQGGIEIYEREIDKWRYVSKEMLGLACSYYGLQVIDEDTVKYTFKK